MSLMSMCESHCTVKRPKIGQDSQAGTTQSRFTTIVALMGCSQQEASARTQELYGQKNIFVDTTFYVYQNPLANTEANDHLESTDMTGATVLYMIKGVKQPVGRGRIWEIDCERIRESVEPNL